MMRRHLLVFWFTLLVGAYPSSATANPCVATSFINNAGNAFLGAARRQSASAFSGVASRYTDISGIAMFALGPHRKLVTRSREAEYVALTRGFIGRFMAKYSDRFAGEGLTIIDCTSSQNALTVNTKLSNGKRIIFKVYKTRRGFLVRDVNISSVWLAQQLRSTFVDVIRRNNGNIDALFTYLRI
jgi:ABC-type transporter MlaC component